MPKVPLGHVVITANAKDSLDLGTVKHALKRFQDGDWGDVTIEDVKENNRALRNEGRLLGVYHDGQHKFWIITEADRSATTILLPEDY